MGSAHKRPLVGPPRVCREYLKEASRCTIQNSTDIRIHYPVDVELPAWLPQCVQRLMWTMALPEAVGTLLKVLIDDRLQDHHHRPLNELVLNAGFAYRPLLPTFLLDPHPFDRRRHIPIGASPLMQVP